MPLAVVEVDLDKMQGVIMTKEGSFADGVKASEELLALLREFGLKIEIVGEPEQHRHDQKPQTVLMVHHNHHL